MRWMTMDPLAEKYYHISPYAYCATNPVNLIDQDGMDLTIYGANGSYVMIFTSLSDAEYHTSIDYGGNYYFDGIETAITFFDALGIIDPSPCCDGISGILSALVGNYSDCFWSAIAIIPYAGDLSKLRKSDKLLEVYNIIVHSHHIIPKAVYKHFEDIISPIMKKNAKDNLINIPAGFHGNHPAYSDWIKDKINEEIASNNGKLTPSSVKKVIDQATRK